MPSMAITWAQRLKRVSKGFGVLLTPLACIPVGHIDIEICNRCGGQVRMIACIEDPVVIAKNPTRLDHKDASHAARP